jgi:hypothetical protein
MAQNTRIVGPRGDGQSGWQNKNPAGGVTYHRTQEEAHDAARQELLATGGGELIIQGENGRIRAKDTIGKADPRGGG